jgi:hypothetical protein
MNKIVLIGQQTPTPRITQYKFPLTPEMKKEVMEAIATEIGSWFSSDKELYEFIEDHKNIEISGITIRIFENG